MAMQTGEVIEILQVMGITVGGRMGAVVIEQKVEEKGRGGEEREGEEEEWKGNEVGERAREGGGVGGV